MTRTITACGLAITAVCAAVLGWLLAPHLPTEVIGMPHASPDGRALLGTDALGRDVLSRVLAGGRGLVLTSLLAALLAASLGAAGGLLAGWSDAWPSRLLTALADVLLAMPLLLVALVLAVSLPGDAAVVAATVCGGTPLTLRVVRDATRSARGSGYVEAARCRGERGAVLLVREVLPSMAGLISADLGMRFVVAVQIAAALSLLGFGAQPPAADWALMIRENLPGSGLNPAGVIAPALALAVLTAGVAAAAALLDRRSA
ncbi:ABC transporter permease subunit [Saccharopolyspora sp. WRP15-2]|uniref:ABC transporter permease subunit n=1 Tax=Saccharopolyspora oryzae TaxID=2997343 RepID=A0ABT4VBG1_9PSEU|nr:ABC transporter permease subunit [Saccharopolyspora oryzae]MDA3631173.1 ABC transporter permease subunit [Saccharopolyspora oryzae]